ncbi:MAG TPA: hypothetical protein VGO07_07495 [Candidatus Saccharimonadales bacterium]|nr:hypothetical protein [Candidatus Saccharimonadales bacterium]
MPLPEGMALEAASAEQCSPADLLCEQVDAFVETFPFPGKNASHRENAITKLFHDVDVWGTVAAQAAEQNVTGMSQILGAINRLEVAAGGESWFAWAIEVAEPPVQYALEKLFKKGDRALNALLERAVSDDASSLEDESDTLRTVEQITGLQYGRMAEWKKYHQLPAFMQRLTKRPYFSEACIQSELANIEQESDDYTRETLAADATAMILQEALGVKWWIADEFKYALAQRSVYFDEHGSRIPFTKGGGVNLEAWSTAIRKYIEHHETLGADRIYNLHDKLGIVNLDRYSPAQLERMCRFAEKDSALLSKLRNSDVTHVVTPKFGDQNNATAHDIETFENDDETVIFSEVEPEGLVRTIVTPNQVYGIKPCTLVVAVHGNMGWFSVDGRRPASKLDIGLDEWGDEVIYDNDFIDLRNLSIGPLLVRSMQPSLATGERSVILSSCFQAVRGKRTRQSVIEAIARQTEPADRIVVSGSDKELDIRRVDGRIRFWNGLENRQATVHSYRRLSHHAVGVVLGANIPGVR